MFVNIKFVTDFSKDHMAIIQDQFRFNTYSSRSHKYAHIRENPYQSIAIAVGVGLLLGMLIGRRD
jgi:ElaB/YqjD/DUF883 family membrane-anchored ribosome-binding protein